MYIKVLKTRPEPHRIKNLMFRNCISLKSMAKELGITEAHLSGVINSKVRGGGKLMKKLDEIANLLENTEVRG
jgi:transcriptional regulator with XRE-family HTH domain